MAVKATASITVAKERDISSFTRFYKIASSSSTPTQPSGTGDPSGWSKTEPAYDGTSTNSLYITDRTIFTDGTASWSSVSKSSSYEAAKQAYNEAQEAKKTATNYMQTVSGGVWVTPSDKKPDASGNATSTTRGVRITDQIDIFRGTKSVAQFGEAVVIGTVESGKLNILIETNNDEEGRFMFRQGQNENFGIIVTDVQFDLLGGSTTVNNDIRLDADDILLRSTRDLNVMYDNDAKISIDPEGILLNLRGKNTTRAYIEGYLSDDYSTGYIDVYANNWKVDSNGRFMAKGMAGMIQMFAGSTAPSGWLMCQGQAISRTTYADLFSVIGTTYGTGDGSTTFNLPDFRGRVGVGVGNGTATGHTSHTLGQKAGNENAIVPYHRHNMGEDDWSSGSSSSGKAAYYKQGTRELTTKYTSYAGSSGNATGANMQPYIGINYIICTGKV